MKALVKRWRFQLWEGTHRALFGYYLRRRPGSVPCQSRFSRLARTQQVETDAYVEVKEMLTEVSGLTSPLHTDKNNRFPLRSASFQGMP